MHNLSSNKHNGQQMKITTKHGAAAAPPTLYSICGCCYSMLLHVACEMGIHLLKFAMNTKCCPYSKGRQMTLVENRALFHRGCKHPE